MAEFAVSDLHELSVEQRLQLVQDIWDTIVDAPGSLALTEEDKRIIDERLAARSEGPGDASPWKDVLARVEERKPGS